MSSPPRIGGDRAEVGEDGVEALLSGVTIENVGHTPNCQYESNALPADGSEPPSWASLPQAFWLEPRPILWVKTKRYALIGFVFLAAAFLTAVGCGREPSLTTGLHVAITNVGWHGEGDGAWQMIGARVDVDCELQKMVAHAEDVERSSTPSVATVCNAIRRDPELLRLPGSVPSCSEYYTGTVEVTGTWEGRRIDLTFQTCEPDPDGVAPDPGARWAHLLGFHFQGPDPPA
jgi:hypothetical protein